MPETDLVDHGGAALGQEQGGDGLGIARRLLAGLRGGAELGADGGEQARFLDGGVDRERGQIPASGVVGGVVVSLGREQARTGVYFVRAVNAGRTAVTRFILLP